MSDSVDGSEFQERRQNDGGLLPSASVGIERSRPEPLARAFHPPFDPTSHAGEETAGISLKQLWDVVKKHRGKIIAFMILATILTGVVTTQLTPMYQATVMINVERRGNGGFVGQQAASSAVGPDSEQVMATQVELIQSDPVLRPATEKYHLLEREKQFKDLTPDEAARFRNAPIKLKRLKVLRTPSTYIIEISYRADNPQFAADVVNMIAQSYVTHAFDSRNRSYLVVGAVVAQRLKELRSKMEQSGAVLATFARELNLIDPEQKTNILTTRLLQLNEDYTNAQSDRLKKEAIYNQTKSGSLASAEVSSQGETLEHLVERLNIARQEFATVRTVYAENNPEYKKSFNEVKELERQFHDLQNNALDRVLIDFRQAASREEMARKIVDDTKKEADDLNSRVFQYAQLKNDAENYKKLYDDLERVTSEEDINRTFQDAVVQIEEPARAAAKQISPSMAINLTLAVLVSGFLAVGFALLSDLLDTKLRGPEQAARLLNVDVIAALPKMKRLSISAGGGKGTNRVVGKMPKNRRTRVLSQYYESIRALRNAIGLADFDGAIRSLMLTSPNAGEGASTIAANLAFSYGLLGKKVLLIDADLRRPSLHTFYEKPMTVGLAEVLEGKCKWNEALLKVAREQLFLLPAGIISERSPDLIAPGIRRLLDEAYAQYDLVIVDAPPLGIAESLQLAALSDAVLVIAQSGATPVKHVAAVYKSLARARANVIGLVMNDVSERDSQGLYEGKALKTERIVQIAPSVAD
jgi:capsular exopolysaccharide synthesis family protein